MRRNQIRLTPVSLRSPIRLPRASTLTHISLALFSILTSLAFAWMIWGSAGSAHAAPPTILETYVPTPEPWGVVINNGKVWVADPQCDVNVSAWPVCHPTTGNILEYDQQSFKSGAQPLQNFTEPSNYSSPFFLALDANGNIWFAEPVTNAIGELNPGTAKWSQWTVPSPKASPFDLTFDQYGHLWFTELSANKIGEFDPTTQQFNETPTPTPSSRPYGITGPDPTSGSMWFTENSSSVHRIASFKPTSTGSMKNGIQEYLTNSPANSGITPHLITFDNAGDIWWTEGFDGEIGRLVISSAQNGTSNGVKEFIVPPASCAPSCATHISAIGIDSNGIVWFDDSLTSRIGSFDSATSTFSMTIIGGSVSSNTHPHDGLAVDNNNNVFFTEEFANKLAEAIPHGGPNPTPTNTATSTSTPTSTATSTPSPTPTVTSTPTPPPGPPPAPVSSKWYFAEGKVGGGFTEYITLENPDPVNPCTVDLQYLLGNGTPVTVKASVGANSRATESVNKDLGYVNTSASQNVSTIVTIDASTPNCKGVVAERPMYFTNFHGVSSGTDVVGATALGKNFYFADISTLNSYNSYISILNPPGGSPTAITATYYIKGSQVGSDTTTVQPGTRGSITPTRLNERVAALVTSTQPVVVERPSYFSNYNAGNAATVSGAGSVIGAAAPSNDWRFAEGYVGSGFQENLVLSNFDTSTDNGTLLLEYDSQAIYSFPISVAHQDQAIYNINQLTANPGAFGGTCISGTKCNRSQNISIEVKTPAGTNIVAEREMYFHYNNNHGLTAIGGTDVTGQSGAPSFTSYSFAEGFTNTGFNEWLTVQNPTTSDETIRITLFNQLGRTYSTNIVVNAQTRFTDNITNLVSNYLVQPGDGNPAYEVSMTVQATTIGGYFVAERPEYFNAFNTQGASDVFGYSS